MTCDLTISPWETWRPVVGFDSYEVSSFGRVRSFKQRKSGRLIGGWRDQDGYAKVCLSDDRLHHLFVHDLVCTAWHGERPIGAVTRHINGDNTCNCPGNLCWGTYKDNSDDMVRHGTVTRGENVNTNRLKAADVLAIRASKRTQVELAVEYKVAQTNISAILTRKTWKHI